MGSSFSIDDDVKGDVEQQQEFLKINFPKDHNLIPLKDKNSTAPTRRNFYFANEELKKDKSFAIKVIKEDPEIIRYVPDELLDDEVFIFEAVKRSGSTFKYASDRLKKNKNIIKEAVKKDSKILSFIDEDLRNDEEFFFELVKVSGNVLKYSTKKILNSRRIVLESVKYFGSSIQFLDASLYENFEEIAL